MFQTNFEENNSQLLVSHSQTLKHKNGVEFEIQLICKHHISLMRKKCGIFAFLVQFLTLKKVVSVKEMCFCDKHFFGKEISLRFFVTINFFLRQKYPFLGFYT